MNQSKWIRELPKDYYDHISWVKYSNMLWKNNNIYIMDNHLSALWCWLDSCNTKERYNFMHIDQHYDMSRAYYSQDIEIFKKRPLIDYSRFAELKRSDSQKINVIRYDNYIVPAYELYPNWFSSSIFLTQKVGDLKSNQWNHSIPRQIHEGDLLYLDYYIDNYIGDFEDSFLGLDEENKSLQWILNIDLDAFITKNEPHVQLFSDDYIRHISSIIQSKMSYIKVITIALSPDFMPGYDYKEKWDNAFRILQIMAREIDILKEFPFPSSPKGDFC